MSFRVDLETYRGPLELLLYLVRKHELEVAEIPIAAIAEQFVSHLEANQETDVDSVGDFLELASTLMEIKSRTVLPMVDEEEEAIDDPREALVERLLQYKKFKDAASLLDEQSRQWQLHFPRLADDLPPRRANLEDQQIHEVELWDLVSAIGRIMRENLAVQPSSIVYDETPIHVYMARIHSRIVEHGRAALSEMFLPGMHKSAVIGVFLAILELARHYGVRTEQEQDHGEIWMLPGADFDARRSVTQGDEYDQPTREIAAGQDD